jgi:hypothetical protein
VTRSVSASCRAAVCAALPILLSAIASSTQAPAQPAETILNGRLATVEPASRRITVVSDGEADLTEMFVAEEAEVRVDKRPVTLSELVIQVGQRVSVTYLMEGARRIARVISVEATEPATALARAMPPTPQPSLP